MSRPRPQICLHTIPTVILNALNSYSDHEYYEEINSFTLYANNAKSPKEVKDYLEGTLLLSMITITFINENDTINRDYEEKWNNYINDYCERLYNDYIRSE